MRLSYCATALVLMHFLTLQSFSQETAVDAETLPVAKPTNAETSGSDKATKSDEPVAQAVPKSGTLAARPLSVNITLTNQSVIRGTLTDTTEVQMKTGLGDLTIPLSEVAGVRFASQEDTSTTVVMLNGDSVTGATDVQRLTVDTEWGAAQINGSGIASILLVPNLQWTSIAGLNGNRWYLTEAKAATPTSASINRTQAVNQPRPSNVVVPGSNIRIQSRQFRN